MPIEDSVFVNCTFDSGPRPSDASDPCVEFITEVASATIRVLLYVTCLVIAVSVTGLLVYLGVGYLIASLSLGLTTIPNAAFGVSLLVVAVVFAYRIWPPSIKYLQVVVPNYPDLFRTAYAKFLWSPEIRKLRRIAYKERERAMTLGVAARKNLAIARDSIMGVRSAPTSKPPGER